MVDLGVAAYMSPLVWQLAFMSTSVVSFLGYFTAISVLVICRPALRKRYPEERDDHALRSAYLIAILLLLFGAAGYVATLIRIFL
jgi:membrane protein implicated in regulation of membrane protease activity